MCIRDRVQRLHQPRLDHFMLFQLLAAIVYRLEEVIEIGILGYFDTRDLHIDVYKRQGDEQVMCLQDLLKEL